MNGTAIGLIETQGLVGLITAITELPGGKLVCIQIVTDVEPGELHVNDMVRFVYRIKDEDRTRRFRRYFWKATPTGEA